jgi:chemotaxis protein CheX
MAGLNAEHINPFLIAGTKILKDMCLVDAQIGKPYINEIEFKDDTVVIMIGVTGEMRGQVMIAIAGETACDIASKMTMMPINQLDELSISALSELGNMILGNAATIFSTKGIAMDITPPTLVMGNMTFTVNYSQNICIPLIYENDRIIEFNVAIR